MNNRVVAAALAATVVGLVLSGCVSPAPDDSSFSDKASTTAAAAASEIETVRLTTQLLLDGRLQRNYADVTISASEDALSSIAQTFSVVEPPDVAADELRDQLEKLFERGVGRGSRGPDRGPPGRPDCYGTGVARPGSCRRPAPGSRGDVRVKRLLGVMLGVLTAIGGFVDIGDLVTNARRRLAVRRVPGLGRRAWASSASACSPRCPAGSPP